MKYQRMRLLTGAPLRLCIVAIVSSGFRIAWMMRTGTPSLSSSEGIS